MEMIQILTIFGSSEQPQGIAALGIDPWAILAQAVTFLLLFWVIKKFALDKIVATLEERRKTIDKGVRLGRKMEAEQEKLSQEIEKQLKKARNEADKILAESREEANAIIREAEEVASRKASSLLADAHAKIEEDIIDARSKLEKDIRELVAEATAIIIEEKIDAEKDMSMIESAISRARG